jgi:hypothetical protein
VGTLNYFITLGLGISGIIEFKYPEAEKRS